VYACTVAYLGFRKGNGRGHCSINTPLCMEARLSHTIHHSSLTFSQYNSAIAHFLTAIHSILQYLAYLQLLWLMSDWPIRHLLWNGRNVFEIHTSMVTVNRTTSRPPRWAQTIKLAVRGPPTSANQLPGVGHTRTLRTRKNRPMRTELANDKRITY